MLKGIYPILPLLFKNTMFIPFEQKLFISIGRFFLDNENEFPELINVFTLSNIEKPYLHFFIFS
jgi:hypothetical protein